MLALLLTVAMQSEPAPTWQPALHMDAPDWAFVPSAETWITPTRGVEALMFAVDIDPTEPVQSEERDDLDVYESEGP